MVIKVTTPPTTEPVNVSDFKLDARWDAADLDSRISAHIKGAREAAEGYQNRAYLTQTIQKSVNSLCGTIELERPPFQELTSVKYYDVDEVERDFAITNFNIDSISEPARMRLKYGITFPAVSLRTLNPIVITYKAGFTTAEQVPQMVKEAIIMYVSALMELDPEKHKAAKEAFYNMLGGNRVVPV